MSIIKSIGKSLTRNRVKSILAVVTSLALIIFMLIFSCNIAQSKKRLENLPEEIPVELHVTNVAGTNDRGLTIDSNALKKIEETNLVTPIVYTARMLYFEPRMVEDPRTIVSAPGAQMVYSMTSDKFLEQESEVTYMDGYGPEMFATDEPTVLMQENYLKSYNQIVAETLGDEHVVEVGDEIEWTFYNIQQRGQMNQRATRVGERKVKIVGTFNSYGNPFESLGATISMIMPYQTMVDFAKDSNLSIWPSTAWYTVDNPYELNKLKDGLREAGMNQADRVKVLAGVYGNTVTIGDDAFIGVAEPLMRDLTMLEKIYPFAIAAVMFIAFLVSYLLIQSRKAEMAIQRSIGVSRGGVFIRMWLESMLLCIIGAVLGGAAVLVLGLGTIDEILIPVLIYLAAYGIGSAVAVAASSSKDVISILTAAE